jgi:hypothetical protein
VLHQPVKGGYLLRVDRLVRANGSGIGAGAHWANVNFAVGIFQADTGCFDALERDGDLPITK